MKRELRVAENFEIAEEIDLDDWLALSGRERLEIGEQMRREHGRRVNRDFADFLVLLNQHGVEFLIIGGVAPASVRRAVLETLQ